MASSEIYRSLALPPVATLDRVIVRYALRCPGCDEELVVRLSVYSNNGVKFYFPCPSCSIPITGQMKGEEDIETLDVQFDDCEKLEVDLSKNYKYITSAAPNIPIKRDAQNLWEIGGAPNAMLLHVAGNNVDLLMRRISFFYAAFRNWSNVRRFYEYYLSEQWDRFFVAGIKAVSPAFIDPGTPHGRESEAYRAVSTCILPLTTYPFRDMITEIIDHMYAYLESELFREFAVRSVESKDLQREQRRLWDCQCLLMRTHDIWLRPGILWDLADPDPAIQLGELSLSLDEFHQLRDAYVACFEACCKSVSYLIAFINTSERRRPDSFAESLPQSEGNSRLRAVTTFTQFKRLSNAHKLTYLYEWPSLSQGITSILDSGLRNSLGHNSIRHDLRSDWILDGDSPVMSFFEFTSHVYRLNTVLQIMMNVLHTTRMAVSQPPMAAERYFDRT